MPTRQTEGARAALTTAQDSDEMVIDEASVNETAVETVVEEGAQAALTTEFVPEPDLVMETRATSLSPATRFEVLHSAVGPFYRGAEVTGGDFGEGVDLARLVTVGAVRVIE